MIFMFNVLYLESISNLNLYLLLFSIILGVLLFESLDIRLEDIGLILYGLLIILTFIGVFFLKHKQKTVRKTKTKPKKKRYGNCSGNKDKYVEESLANLIQTDNVNDLFEILTIGGKNRKRIKIIRKRKLYLSFKRIRRKRKTNVFIKTIKRISKSICNSVDRFYLKCVRLMIAPVKRVSAELCYINLEYDVDIIVFKIINLVFGILLYIIKVLFDDVIWVVKVLFYIFIVIPFIALPLYLVYLLICVIMILIDDILWAVQAFIYFVIFTTFIGLLVVMLYSLRAQRLIHLFIQWYSVNIYDLIELFLLENYGININDVSNLFNENTQQCNMVSPKIYHSEFNNTNNNMYLIVRIHCYNIKTVFYYYAQTILQELHQFSNQLMAKHDI